MEKKNFLLVLFLVLVLTLPVLAVKWSLDLETGAVFPGYNDVRIPNETGTLFSLKNDLEIEKIAYFRLRLNANLGDNHGLSILYAPLTLNARGELPKPVFFEGVLFPAGAQVKGLFTFNSYRLTYRYRLIRKANLNLWIGFTAKIRDAEVRLTSDQLESPKTNVGFVPLLHAYLDWNLGKGWGLLFEADALAAKQGRAEDVALAIQYKVAKKIAIKVGYRIVEGGANVDEVYNFALINYLFTGLIFTF